MGARRQTSLLRTEGQAEAQDVGMGGEGQEAEEEQRRTIAGHPGHRPCGSGPGSPGLGGGEPERKWGE